MTKPQLRREIRERLGAMTAGERAAASERICRTLANHPAVISASTIAVFDPLPSEPDISAFSALIAAERSATGGPLPRFCFPRCEDDRLVFHCVDTEAALLPVPGRRFREPDPAACALVSPAEIDLMIVPGLAFSPDGSARLGRGGGFYDRFLADPSLNAARYGVCFSTQLHEDIPRDDHDQPVDEVITEESG